MLRSDLKPDSVMGQSRLELDAAPAVDVLQLLARWMFSRFVHVCDLAQCFIILPLLFS